MSLRNKKNNNKGSNSVINNPAPFFFGRVMDTILTSDHPEYKGEDSIGIIFFHKTKNDDNTTNTDALDVALPAFPFISSVPLKSEVVQIFPGPSSRIYRKLKGEKSNKAYYYYPALNIHNNVEHNALPSNIIVSSGLLMFINIPSFKVLSITTKIYFLHYFYYFSNNRGFKTRNFSNININSFFIKNF